MSFDAPVPTYTGTSSGPWLSSYACLGIKKIDGTGPSSCHACEIIDDR